MKVVLFPIRAPLTCGALDPMLDTVFFDAAVTDDERRAGLYAGRLYMHSPTPETRAFIAFAAELIREAFHPLDPERAQYELPLERFVAILGELKPRFIHHPESKRHVAAVLASYGCDLDKVYFDVPRLRSSTSDQYLTTGIAYAWHPHRDTWYSAPPCQINWWMPIFPLASENAMAFHPRYWGHGIANSSREYNYYRWNQQHRGGHVTTYVKSDPRPLPRATVPVELEPQIRLLPPPGGMLVFSGAQMHSSVPNTSGKTRWSIDFRTVHLDDAVHRRGAPKSDEQCTGTTMRDYLRASDHAKLPEDVIALHNDGSEGDGNLVYDPYAAAAAQRD
jgi:hypothetical protein